MLLCVSVEGSAGVRSRPERKEEESQVPEGWQEEGADGRNNVDRSVSVSARGQGSASCPASPPPEASDLYFLTFCVNLKLMKSRLDVFKFLSVRVRPPA